MGDGRTSNLGSSRRAALGLSALISRPNTSFAWWSAETGYVVFLASIASALALGGAAVPHLLVCTEAAKP